ncbi:MAG TPA: glycosyltransferase family 2 protein [Longilinea sp.]|nr:glycosyltransferase family 2 protein [Longilinea sp.]
MPDRSHMDLSIILISWNVAELLTNCLRSIAAHPPDGDFEVWVVDNASQDHSVQIIQEQFPQVNLILNEKNVGFAAANNQALHASSGRYALLLNPDTIVAEGTLQKLVSFLDENPQAGAAGSLYQNPDGSLQPSCYPFPTVARELWRLLHLDKLYAFGVYDMQQWSKETPREVDALQGASLLLRRSALEKTGLLDTEYFMYSEEIDLCYRLQQEGWSRYWVPQSRIIHYGGQSTRQAALKMFLQLYSSKVQFFRKHYGETPARSYKRVLKFTSGLRLVLTTIGSAISPQNRLYYQQLHRNYEELIAALPAM